MEKQLEKEYIPILKYVMILSEKGVPATVDAVGRGLAIGSIDAKRDSNGKWHVAKHEMLKRIKASGKKFAPVEAGYYSIHGFIYHLSENGVDMHEDNIGHLLSLGLMESKIDKCGRLVIPAHELEKRIKQIGNRK